MYSFFSVYGMEHDLSLSITGVLGMSFGSGDIFYSSFVRIKKILPSNEITHWTKNNNKK